MHGKKIFPCKMHAFYEISGKMHKMHGKSQDFLSKMHGNDEKLVNCIAYLAILANNACMQLACLGKIPELHTMSQP